MRQFGVRGCAGLMAREFGDHPEATMDRMTLPVGGRHDECTPGYLEDMHRRIAGSQLTIIEDAPHLCFAEQPGRLHRNYQFFLTEI